MHSCSIWRKQTICNVYSCPLFDAICPTSPWFSMETLDRWRQTMDRNTHCRLCSTYVQERQERMEIRVGSSDTRKDQGNSNHHHHHQLQQQAWLMDQSEMQNETAAGAVVEDCQVNMMGNLLEPFASFKRYRATFYSHQPKYLFGLSLSGQPTL